MSDRDDIVIRPHLHPQGPSAPVKDRRDRVVSDRRRRRGLLGRLVRRSIVGRALRRVTGIPGRLRGLAPVGAAAGLAVGALVALRIVSGRTFSGMGDDLSQMLYGELDENAMGARDARMLLEADPNVAAHIGTGAHARGVFTDMKAALTKIHAGRQAFLQDKDFQVNGLADKVVESFQRAWKDEGGDEAVRRAAETAREAVRRARQGR